MKFESLIETYDFKALISNVKMLLKENNFHESQLIDLGPKDMKTEGFIIKNARGFYPNSVAIGYTCGFSNENNSKREEDKLKLRKDKIKKMQEILKQHYKDIQYMDNTISGYKPITGFPGPFLIINLKD